VQNEYLALGVMVINNKPLEPAM